MALASRCRIPLLCKTTSANTRPRSRVVWIPNSSLAGDATHGDRHDHQNVGLATSNSRHGQDGRVASRIAERRFTCCRSCILFSNVASKRSYVFTSARLSILRQGEHIPIQTEPKQLRACRGRSGCDNWESKTKSWCGSRTEVAVLAGWARSSLNYFQMKSRCANYDTRSTKRAFAQNRSHWSRRFWIMNISGKLKPQWRWMCSSAKRSREFLRNFMCSRWSTISSGKWSSTLRWNKMLRFHE